MSALAKQNTPPPIYLINFENYLKPKQKIQCQPLQRFEKPVGSTSYLIKNIKRLKLLRWYGSVSKRIGQVPLPRFLRFLRARNDDGLCKRKTGFEIYCEMASIHGFHIFVGAKTWQRILWWLLICTAVLLSLIIVIMSLSMSEETPTIRFIDTMMKPTAEVPFPAVTICSFKTISRQRLQTKAKELGVSTERLQTFPALNSSVIEQLGNTSWLELLEDLAPPICPQIKFCQWENGVDNCLEKLLPIWTLDQRLCCSFNYRQQLFSSHLGVGIVLRSKEEDLSALEILIHESHEIPTEATPRLMVPSGSEAHIMLQPFVNRFSKNLESIPLQKRGCYFPRECQLISSDVYYQSICQAECRTKKMLKLCGCVPPNYPRQESWSICDLKQMQCVINFDHDEIIKGEQKNCECLPPCEFNRYEFQGDIRLLKRIYNNMSNKSNPKRTNKVRLRVYYDSPIAEEQVLDEYENWLTFMGTFGGITGLFMGCSFVSVFELIFFSCVRPTCNWLTRQQILWRRRRIQRVGDPTPARSLGLAN
ncbi:pickpocket protein 11 [Drosophila rhopaloa]|uniref:Pickpocket protein 11 n=1 Tax=Drosophila rhopaloa TaxID=1041015 RepID=A0A6P4EF74_DRORH|nr:pickpocket protein 11 [Drosophila rhopaloa]